MNNVAVLLSSYNGEDFIYELIESLQNQTYKKFDLIIRDDGSSDTTKDIINSFERNSDLSIIIIEDSYKQDKGELSLSSSFFKLVKFANKFENYKYFLFCDQDDVWHSNKIERMVEVVSREEALSPGKPILAHSNLALIDDEGNSLNSSFWEWQNINPYRNSTSRLLMQNTVTGCATIMNRILSLKLEEGPNLYYHDHRVALIASLKGCIIPIPEILIDYRQHGKNVSGAGVAASSFVQKTSYIISSLIKLFFKFEDTKNRIDNHYESLNKIISYGVKEAKQLNEIYQNDMNNKSKESIIKLSNFYEKTNCSRFIILTTGNFLPNSFYRSLGLLFVSLFKKKNNRIN